MRIDSQYMAELRDQFAITALASVFEGAEDGETYEAIAERAWNLADAMMKERQERK